MPLLEQFFAIHVFAKIFYAENPRCFYIAQQRISSSGLNGDAFFACGRQNFATINFTLPFKCRHARHGNDAAMGIILSGLNGEVQLTAGSDENYLEGFLFLMGNVGTQPWTFTA